MVILIAPYTFDPARVEALIAFANAEYGARVRQQPGFRSLGGGIDRAGGRGVGHYVFDSAEQVAPFLAAYEATMAARFAALGLRGDDAEMVVYEYLPPVVAAG